jgi:hypothetical protein
MNNSKTVLTLAVYYNSKTTDPEALAVAFDKLLETVMSTPGILEEYDDPEVGEFLVDNNHRPLTTNGYVLAFPGGLDGHLLARQRELVSAFASNTELPSLDAGRVRDIMGGLESMLDCMADQLHDKYGIDCLLEDCDDDERAEDQ